MQFDKSGKKDVNKDWEKKIFISAFANFQYPTVKTKRFKKDVPIKQIKQKMIVCYLCGLQVPHGMEQGIELGKALGFEFRTVALFGIKWSIILDNILFLIVKCVFFKEAKYQHQEVQEMKTINYVQEGSIAKKPIEVLKLFKRMFSTQDRIEFVCKT